MTDPIYAIGDIHGQLHELQRALSLIERDGGPEARIVFLGDYTDRGPDSRGVLDRLVQGQKAGSPWTFIKGNHDRMFEWFMQDYPRHEAYLPINLYWLHERLGGDTTLASYGVEFTSRNRMLAVHRAAREAVPQDHLDFLANLDLSFQTDDLFFCHAGIRPGVPLDKQDEEDLLWIRGEFHDETAPHPKLIVHGHTPISAARHYGNRINLDSGAGYGERLSVAVFEGRESWLLTDDGRVPLTP
ncbi:serine/threonine protein phosphatase [Sulfitobacter alexandrii]|uniref:Serine/threonine protein phosphatase n=1 Tax=Sulfitobacter alexandrii TaxID=1917485 RepID=A0A1J0WN42_9RHOB|nr:metallophosphoesterase family protein [Sulfitobacter alexandrii]APE45568.1 serine/threonine protein phosphatase [Sulfitobacter alexandrii]